MVIGNLLLIDFYSNKILKNEREKDAMICLASIICQVFVLLCHLIITAVL